jgi:DNA mismatch repair protein MutL
MKGRYPVCCLFLEINPAAVDVNIHPSKREVKFHREFEIRKFVTQAVRDSLLAFHNEPAKTTLSPNSPSIAPRTFQQPEILPAHPLAPPAAAPNETSARLAPADLPGTSFSPVTPPPAPPVQAPLKMGFLPNPNGVAEHRPFATPENKVPGSAVVTPLLNIPLRLIGVVGKLYVLLESDRGLVLLDQHAAHERILFEQMLNRLEQNEGAPSQKLLLPETIELPPRDAQFLRDQLTALTRLGVGLSEFGERTFLLDALPPFVKAADPRRFVLDLVDELRAAGREVNLARLGEHTVAKTVCRHAVKANDYLGGPELENLVQELRQCAMPYTCPHGRPTLIELNYRELEKKFGRSV